MDNETKTRENLLRRMAARQGLSYHRSRRRDPRALDFGQLQLRAGRTVVLETTDLDVVEDFLTGKEA